MNEVNYFIFHCSSSKKKFWCLYFESTSGGDESNSKRRKDTKRANPRRISPSVKYIILNINLQKVFIK